MGAGGSEPWLPPPSLGAGLKAGAQAAAPDWAGNIEAEGRSEIGVQPLPKRHARFMERFRAAKEARTGGGGGGAGGGPAGVTSFGALLPDVVGRAD